MDIYNNIANIIFRFAYPVGFIGAIMFSINSIIAVDFFSIFSNLIQKFFLTLDQGAVFQEFLLHLFIQI